MEPKHFFLTAAILGSGTLAAQPTLTAGNNVPMAGAQFPVSTGSIYDTPGPAGASQLYGFWMLPPSGNRTYFYVAPSVTPTSMQAPSATLLSTDGGTDTLFWTVTGAGLELVAEKRSAYGMIPYTDAGLEIKYPCTYNTTWSDPTGGSFTVSGFPVQRTGTVSGNADGYGTLELPRAVMNDVLRVRVKRTTMDASAITNIYRSSETHYFFSATVPHPILKLVHDTTIVGTGAPSVSRLTEWMFGNGVAGVGDLSYDDVRFTAYPNPASGAVNISLKEDGGTARFIEVFNAAGQFVMRRDIPMRSSTVLGAFDVGPLAPGLYEVRLSSAAGSLGTQRLVVE